MSEGRCIIEQECQFEEKILETHRAIYGNGDPKHGMLWMVEQNTNTIAEMAKLVDSWKKHAWKVFGLIIVGVCSAVFNLVIEIIKSHVSIH